MRARVLGTCTPLGFFGESELVAPAAASPPNVTVEPGAPPRVHSNGVKMTKLLLLSLHPGTDIIEI